jgi:RNA recognition motif. (a.k.a. RRM, RBD, or RNP domain)
MLLAAGSELGPTSSGYQFHHPFCWAIVHCVKSVMTEQELQDEHPKDRRKKVAKRKCEADDADLILETTGDCAPCDEKSSKSKEERKRRRLEREKRLDQVPKVDENGIRYTKQQIRHMRKRVERGLHPVETPSEKQARLAQEAQLRREEEAELSGLMEGREEITGDVPEDVDEPNLETNKDDNDEEEETSFSYEKRPKDASETLAERPRVQKKKRAKPVPSDYVCSACQNADGQPPHWIYDCLNKKTVPGTNQVSRKNRGLQDPSETKLFVSGLPFDTTAKDVSELFASKADVSVVHVKLIKFEDTKRCKGQAFVTFATPEAAKKALRLNGSVIPSTVAPTKPKGSAENKQKKELKLKVTKVLNRVVTKTKRSGEDSSAPTATS